MSLIFSSLLDGDRVRVIVEKVCHIDRFWSDPNDSVTAVNNVAFTAHEYVIAK